MLNHYSSSNNSMYNTRIKNNEKDFILEYPVPGFDKEDVKIKVKENYLILSGDNKEFKFEKAYELNEKIDIENISAEVQKGILKVRLPKIAPTYKEITIN